MLRGALLKVAESVNAKAVPDELAPYRKHVQDLCALLMKRVDQNLADLGTGSESILEDVVSNSQLALAWSVRLSAHWAGPVLRHLPEDRLALRNDSVDAWRA